MDFFQFLLDYIYDCSNDSREPSLNCSEESAPPKDAAKGFSYHTSLTDNEDDISNLNDLHLAETDLVKCALRSNILQRIR